MNAQRRLSENRIIIALSLIAVTGAIVWVRASQSTSERADQEAFSETPFDLRPFDPSDERAPLLQPGEQVPLSQADGSFGLPSIRPNHELASDESLSEAWVGGGEIAYRYESGLRVYLAGWPEESDPVDFYSSSQKETGAGELVSIRGQVGWAVPKDGQQPGYPTEAFVLFVTDGVEVSLQGGDLTTTELLDVAESVGSASGTAES
ncbi:MAG: hypothetical protein WD206_04615 [Actinomycetota bacterium]